MRVSRCRRITTVTRSLAARQRRDLMKSRGDRGQVPVTTAVQPGHLAHSMCFQSTLQNLPISVMFCNHD
jgi:hypothetical protein